MIHFQGSWFIDPTYRKELEKTPEGQKKIQRYEKAFNRHEHRINRLPVDTFIRVNHSEKMDKEFADLTYHYNGKRVQHLPIYRRNTLRSIITGKPERLSKFAKYVVDMAETFNRPQGY